MKHEVARRRQELIEERERKEHNALVQRDIARNAEVARANDQGRVVLEPDGAYFTSRFLTRVFGFQFEGAKASLTTYTREETDCYKADEVETLFDSGEAGLDLMGSFEIFRVHELGDLDWWEQELLGFRETHPPSGFRGMIEYFQEVHEHPGVGVNDAARQRAWAKNASCLEDCLPLEIGFDHEHRAILYVRKLKGREGGPGRQRGDDGASGDADGE